MKAILLEKPECLTTIELPEPEAPAPGQAVVRVHSVGICGTDISGYLGKMPFYSYPRIPGHELGVEVVSVGQGVANVKPGDKCSVEPYMNCGECHACRKGATNCCANLKVLGVMTDGGMRPRFTVPARKLHPSRSLSFDQLAIVETLAIGCHAVNRCDPKPGDTVLVIGAGPIGLAAVEFVKLTGARLVVLDMNAQRLDFCKNVMRVDETMIADGEVEKKVKTLNGGFGPDIVIDATGSSASMSAAFGYVAPTGKVVYVGITTKEVVFKHPIFHRPEGTLLCSRNALPGDFTRIIKLIEDAKIDTRPWITHRCSFDSVIAEFPTLIKPETGVIKAVVRLD
jgi:alcohol dehydrogenase